jgi:hypothetical protein
MSGFMGDLSPEQQKSLEVFKEALGEEKLPQHDDYDFLRFLRARQFHLEKALTMYRCYHHVDFAKKQRWLVP